MINILCIIIIFSLLVIAHELGHFIAARRNGVAVDEFGIGFPPKLFGLKKRGTLYSINLLPIGGFVRLKGEDDQVVGKDSFSAQPYKAKTKIILAGVAVNLAIAYAILLILMVAGLPAILPNGFVNVGPIKPASIEKSALLTVSVAKGSAAEKAGLKPGTEIIQLNSTPVLSFDQLRDFTQANAGQEVLVTTRKNGETKQVQVQLGNDPEAGYLGLVAQPIEIARYSPITAIFAAAIGVVQLALATLAAFGSFIAGLFTKAQVSSSVAGPVGIVGLFTGVMQFGWRYVLAFIASISLSLAVINSLPIPGLDGGRFALITLARLGFKITPKNEALVHYFGFGFLIILIVIVTISDISRL